ncbi:MAG: DsbA family oxidoreductase [Steroidobacteraceae bacterium]|jgi:predicted DsbA family dithiol-disulfide isomerase|nr:DsbA family oxidoreductase [Steroidobacteraceae bacterium]
MSPPFTIDVWSDTVCPWCYLGERRLAQALAARPGAISAVRWQPFELNPDLPEGGEDRRTYLRRKFGDPDRFRDAQARLLELGRAAGIDYRFDAIARMPNTRAAHALARSAGERQGAVVEALFRAYFTEGGDVGDPAVLVEIAAAAGLDAGTVRAQLAAREGYAAIEEQERRAHAMGISGVPFFVLAGRWAVSGAQEVDALVRAIDHVGAELAKSGAPAPGSAS